jgi:drug/metabolite transporter (DMT)-like permease
MRKPLPLLVLLALIWGSSFMFIKVSVRDLAPSTLILGRLGLAALTLALVVPYALGARATIDGLRRHARALVLVGLVNTALPFWLLSWGETRLDSGLASIIQASVPIFNALIAFGFFHEQRVTGRKLVGVLIGFVGVALLVGAQPHGKILAAVAVVGMAGCYACGGLLTRHLLASAPAQVTALGTTLVAAVAAVPGGVAQASRPSLGAAASVAMLGIVGTAFAYLLFFTIIARAGAAYASLVTYLVPPVALAYGAIFLGERFGLVAFAGLALIFAGVALGTGSRLLLRLRRAGPVRSTA